MEKSEVDDRKARYRGGTGGEVEGRRTLAEAINATLDPMRARRSDILAKPERIKEILIDGSSRARVIAQETMREVRDAVKLNYT